MQQDQCPENCIYTKNLKKLGIGHKEAMLMGNTRKKPWRISRTPTLNFALPLSLFVQKKGLLLLG